ncbi:hypothetical protein ES703_35394 [subsurface metagenome]
MSRSAVGLLVHIPVGLANVAFAWFSPAVAVIFGGGFLAYEVTQGSKPHLDIKGWLWGIALGMVGFIIYRGLASVDRGAGPDQPSS